MANGQGGKDRRHSNNSGRQSIKSGKVERDVRRMAKRLGIPYRFKKA